MMSENIFSNLTPAQKEKLKTATSKEELMTMLEQESIPMTDEQLEALSGGVNSYYVKDTDGKEDPDAAN